jgi:hypothetical protein
VQDPAAEPVLTRKLRQVWIAERTGRGDEACRLDLLAARRTHQESTAGPSVHVRDRD